MPQDPGFFVCWLDKGKDVRENPYRVHSHQRNFHPNQMRERVIVFGIVKKKVKQGHMQGSENKPASQQIVRIGFVVFQEHENGQEQGKENYDWQQQGHGSIRIIWHYYYIGPVLDS